MRARPQRPINFQGDLRNLPEPLDRLKASPNWVCWRWEPKIDKNGAVYWTKPPYRPEHPRLLAKNNDPSTWGTYEQALVAFEAGQCDGIGYNLFGQFFQKVGNKSLGRIISKDEVATYKTSTEKEFRRLYLYQKAIRRVG